AAAAQPVATRSSTWRSAHLDNWSRQSSRSLSKAIARAARRFARRAPKPVVSAAQYRQRQDQTAPSAARESLCDPRGARDRSQFANLARKARKRASPPAATRRLLAEWRAR